MGFSDKMRAKYEEMMKFTFIEQNPEIQERLVNVSQMAYSENMKRLVPSLGDDNQSFGFNIHKAKIHFLSQLADECSWITILQRNPQFIFKVGNFRASAYKTNDQLNANIETSFPRNKGGAPKMAEYNSYQFGLPFDDDCNIEELPYPMVILADMGNSTFGLGKVFVAIPSNIENGVISEWGAIVTLWERAGSDELFLPVAPATQDLPPTERTPQVALSLKEKVKEGNE